jgi:hypothetical protein
MKICVRRMPSSRSARANRVNVKGRSHAARTSDGFASRLIRGVGRALREACGGERHNG